jgi:hypothetical protein
MRFPFRSAKLTVKNHVAPGIDARRYSVIEVGCELPTTTSRAMWFSWVTASTRANTPS